MKKTKVHFFYVILFLSSLCVRSQTTTYSVLSTAYNRASGTFFSLGNIDNSWFYTKIEDLVVPNNPGSVINYPNDPTYVVGNVGNNTFPGIIANHSINMAPNTNSLGLKLFTYRTYFTLPNLLTTSNRYSLSFKLSADDAVHEVMLNGTQKAQFLSNTYNNVPGINKPYLLTVPICDTDFVSGLNYIDVVVADAGGSVGYYAEVTLFETVNPSSTQMSVTSLCNGSSASAVATITTAVANPTISYYWTNSAGVLVSQTNGTSSLTNTVTNLPNGTYTVQSQVNGTCGSIATQTITVNCVTSPPLCSGNLGAPVFFEDFGSGASLYGAALPPGVTNYPYLQGVPNNGTYVIASSSNPSGTNAGYVNDGDHTGNANGYMMVVNSDYAATEVYRKHVTGLCPGTTYVFSAYLANNNSPDAVTNVCAFNYVYANIKFQTEFPVGTILNSTTSGNLAVATSSLILPWIQYGFAFTTGPGQTSVDVVLKNNAPGGCGNDYAVDDISLSPCGPGVALSIVPNQTVFCPGDPVSLQSNFTSGSYTVPQYQWQYSGDGGVTWTNISGATSPNYNIASVAASQSGMYQLLVSENGNINLSSCRIIAGPLTFSVTSAVTAMPSATICPGVSTTLTATGATSYSWSTNATGNSIAVSPTSTTVYTVTGTVGTCTSQATSTVNVASSSTLSIAGIQQICAGQTTTLTAGGGSSYNWSPSNTLSSSTGSVVIATPVVTTTYSVAGSSTLCSSPGVITVSVSPLPTLTLSPNTALCLGISSSTTLTASGAGSYVWNNASSLSASTGSIVTATPNATTVYTVTGSTGLCTNTATVTVSVNATPTITSTSVNNTSCGLANGSATVTSSPANNTYTWSSGVASSTNTVGTLAAGNYTVTVLNGICQTNTVISILGSTALSITASTIVPTNCNVNNGSITVTDNLTASNYSWNPNVSLTNNAVGLAEGNYSLTVSNGACTTSTIFAVSSIGGPVSSVATMDAICGSANGIATVTNVVNGLSPYQYNFNNAGFSSVTTYSNLVSGNYLLIVKDANGCLYSQTVTVGETSIHSVADITTNAPACFENDGSFVINNITGGVAPYTTSFGGSSYSADTVFAHLGPGNYTLSVMDSNNCETGFMLVMPENNGEHTMYIPNTFTPNNDKVNDVWYVKGTCLNAFNCLIYNRWGEKIRELKDINEGWDGTYKGASVPDGVYVYLIEIETKNGTINKAGHITIYR
ncbi:MAG: T9SS type B sorting domain-containing protein [Bacteroidota bacterium]